MKMTHTGVIKPHWRNSYTTKLRETKNFWVTETGIKFRKSDGVAPSGSDWSPTKLLLDTVKPL